jgi:Reverse transcriptase (RNA-dependent DNA polymerase)
VDIRDYFSSLDHSWLERFLGHRIADRRVLRLIQKWLKAGVIEDGAWSKTREGTPQGASVSTLLANVYLHYVFDLWAHQWRHQQARGEMIIVRFADDRVPRTQKEDRCRTNRRMRCCMRDEGARRSAWWPFAVVLQGKIANHREVRRSRAGVPSVAEKACLERVRCGFTKASESEPPLKCRKRIGDIRNRSLVVAPGRAWREPVYWPGGCPA